jgi:tetratricopeptide (TPR) repeat protein
MFRSNKQRALPVVELIAAITVAAGCALAQVPATPIANPRPVQAAATPKLEPNAEDRGDSLMAHQRYQAAIEAYKQASHNNASAWNKMGIAYQMMFNLVDANHAYGMSLKLNPKNPVVLNNLGTVYDALRQFHSAEHFYRKALKIDPKSALILKNLGTDLLAQHKYQKGWDTYKAALAVDPTIFDHATRPRVENPASLQDRGAMNFYMAKSCARAGMRDRAIEYLRAAINEGFTNPKKINADTEFASLRGIPEFEQLLAEQKPQ